ncbi:hypothetical protein [Frondihabitans cladoniiphilus]|uniref:Uncharacterized protein n=1 Tax=Frondihabitans cladoniiphilus TaxID=715785 RepID=A0ABP8W3P1_9MICO
MSSYRSEPGVVGLRVEHLSRRRRDPARIGLADVTPIIGRGDGPAGSRAGDGLAQSGSVEAENPSYAALMFRCRAALVPVVALPIARYDDTAPSARTR